MRMYSARYSQGGIHMNTLFAGGMFGIGASIVLVASMFFAYVLVRKNPDDDLNQDK